MVKAFGWSLHEIDETDIESLLPFVFRFIEPETKKIRKAPGKRVYCDEVSWL